jgi:hypothetical protein
MAIVGLFDLLEATAQHGGKVRPSVPDEMHSFILKKDVHGLDGIDPVVCQPGRSRM